MRLRRRTQTGRRTHQRCAGERKVERNSTTALTHSQLFEIAQSKLVETANDINYGTLLHELLHVLGFNTQSFNDFVDFEGNPLPPDTVAAPVTLPYGKPTFEIRTPAAVARAKAHFGCETLQGVELEEVS